MYKKSKEVFGFKGGLLHKTVAGLFAALMVFPNVSNVDFCRAEEENFPPQIAIFEDNKSKFFPITINWKQLFAGVGIGAVGGAILTAGARLLYDKSEIRFVPLENSEKSKDAVNIHLMSSDEMFLISALGSQGVYSETVPYNITKHFSKYQVLFGGIDNADIVLMLCKESDLSNFSITKGNVKENCKIIIFSVEDVAQDIPEETSIPKIENVEVKVIGNGSQAFTKKNTSVFRSAVAKAVWEAVVDVNKKKAGKPSIEKEKTVPTVEELD
jgi:hypothetical protein